MLHVLAVLLGAVTGRVVDGPGRPAAGAAVHLVRWTAESLPGSRTGIGSVVEVRAMAADGEGRFRFEVDEGQVVGVWADHGDSWASLPTAPLLAGDAVELRLLPTVMLRGRVVTTGPGGAGGKRPAPGAAIRGGLVPVRSRDPGARPDPHTGRHFAFTAVTDAAGTFTLRAFTDPDAQAQGAGFSVRLGGMHEWVQWKDPAAPLEVVLCPADRVQRWHARLVDSKTGAPVAGVVVGRPYETFPGGRSDASGRVEVAYEGKPEIALFPRQHQWQWSDANPFAPVTQEAPTIPLERGKTLAVRLLRPDRSPIARAPVVVVGSVHGHGLGKRALDAFEATDADGRLELGLPAIASCGFVEVDGAWVPLFDTMGTEPVPQGDVILDPSARLSGQVLDAKGTPVAQARVLLLPDQLSDQGWISFKAAVRSVPMDKNGRFLVTGLLPGKVQVAVDAPDLLPWFGVWTASKDGPSHPVTLHPGEKLAGRTVSADGTPIAGARVTVTLPDEDGNRRRFDLGIAMEPMTGASPPQLRGLSDEQGRFEIGGVPVDEDLSVAASAQGATKLLVARPIKVRAQRDLELVLVPFR